VGKLRPLPRSASESRRRRRGITKSNTELRLLSQRLQREAAREVISGTAIEPHSAVALAGDDAKAIVLDFVQPLIARG
jgi:hypothetical protein